ncbi:MotA/TolQ/ExbB proton channel family protein [Isosphaeraceae bacterium EP7]
MPLSSRTRVTRKAPARAWAFAVAAWLTCLAWVPATAQETAKDAPKVEAPAEPAPPAVEVAPADANAAPAATEAPATSPPRTKNMLMWAIEASGLMGVFLVGLSIYFTALVIRLFMELRLSEAVPLPLVEKLETAIKDRKFQEAYDACRDNDSFLAKLVRTGVAALPNGRAEAKEAMSDVSDEVVTGMETRISYLAIIGSIGPMIGLVGTIWGMIQSFQEIATAAGSQPKPEKVAEGISTALFITLEGVSLAVPAIFFFGFFRNRIAHMTVEANKVADRTIAALLAASKQQAKPAA